MSRAEETPRQSKYPVDLDGDGSSTVGDRIAFQAWVDHGGNESDALTSAKLKEGKEGPILDLTGFFTALQASREGSIEESAGGVEAAQVGNGVDTSIVILDSGAVANFPAITAIKLWRGNRGLPSGQPPNGNLDWTFEGFNDSAWETVNTTPIGFPNQPFPLNDMQNNYTSFYVRIKFRLAALAQFNPNDVFSTLDFDLGVDDGFVAYLRGSEIRRLNAPGTFEDGQSIGVGSVATAQNSSTSRVSGYNNLYTSPFAGVEPFIEPEFEAVLAIQVLNFSIGNTDCILAPRIHARKRGPFLSRSEVDTSQSPSDFVPTAYEVVVRLRPGLAPNLRVVYFTDSDPTERTSDEVTIDSGEDLVPDSTMHRVKIPGKNGATPNPALPPSATVTYGVFIGSTARFEEDDLTFKTAPQFTEPFTFVAFGQSGLRTTAQSNLAGVINSLDANLYINAGDAVIRNNRYTSSAVFEDEVEPPLSNQAIDHRFYNPYAPAMARAVFYSSPGDEDLETRFVPVPDTERTDYDEAHVLPEMTSTEAGDGTSEKFYSFDYGSAHFTVIQSARANFVGDTDADTGLLSGEVLGFLQDDLAATRKFWKVVVIHHPAYTSKATDLELNFQQDDDELRRRLEDPNLGGFGGFEALGVDLVISAHEKFYEQSHAVFADVQGNPTVAQTGPHYVDPGAPVYVITGGAGENLYQCLPGAPNCLETALASFTFAMRRQAHVTKFTIEDNKITIQPVSASGAAIDIDPDPAVGKTSSTITKTTFASFRRGDADQNGAVELTDAVFTNNWLFSGMAAPHCLDAADSNDDGQINVTDSVFTLNFLFNGGQAPPPPGPDNCGPDPTPDLGTGLSCLEYASCP